MTRVPLTITEEELAEGLDLLEDAAREVLGAPARAGCWATSSSSSGSLPARSSRAP